MTRWEIATVRTLFIVSLIAAAYHFRPFHESSLKSVLMGAALGLAFVFIEMRLRKASLTRLIGAVVVGASKPHHLEDAVAALSVKTSGAGISVTAFISNSMGST